MILATEVALRAIGTALAALSMGFAVYMFAYSDHRPHINGMEYLAIFAQPRGAPAAKAPEAPLVLPQVDMTATGSFAAAPEPPPAPRPVEMIAARPDRVWLLVNGAIKTAAPGDDVATVGHVAKIVERDGEWALLDDRGATLLKLRKRANGAAMFSRRMIFQ
jgi:hypothetical protein